MEEGLGEVLGLAQHLALGGVQAFVLRDQGGEVVLLGDAASYLNRLLTSLKRKSRG